MNENDEQVLPQLHEEAIAFTLQSALRQNVKFIRLWFTDIFGSLKGLAINVDELENVMKLGVSIDGASIEDPAFENSETDVVAMPDSSTWQILPWRPSENAVARMFCDLRTPSGVPLENDCREILNKNLARCNAAGFSFYVAPELEYYFVDENRDPEQEMLSSLPQRITKYFDQTSLDGGAKVRRTAILWLEDMGIPVKHSHHERSPFQHEIVLRHTNAMAMADAVMTFRAIMRELAEQENADVIFMPKPFNDMSGSGMHIQMSLFKGDSNAFFSPDKNRELSEVGEHFCAGLIRHAREITVVTNQWVNSYKRIVPKTSAPTLAGWTSGYSSNAVRLPVWRTGREEAVRIEYKAPDAACNPYLVFALLLSAGLEGIEKGYSLPPKIEDNPTSLSTAEREAKGIVELPKSLREAINIAKDSELLEKTLGKWTLNKLLESKAAESERYERFVTDYEKARHTNLP